MYVLLTVLIPVSLSKHMYVYIWRMYSIFCQTVIQHEFASCTNNNLEFHLQLLTSWCSQCKQCKRRRYGMLGRSAASCSSCEVPLTLLWTFIGKQHWSPPHVTMNSWLSQTNCIPEHDNHTVECTWTWWVHVHNSIELYHLTTFLWSKKVVS